MEIVVALTQDGVHLSPVVAAEGDGAGTSRGSGASPDDVGGAPAHVGAARPPVAEVLDRAAFPRRARDLAPQRPRWVWADTAAVYPVLLEAGVRVERCYDLRLCRAILDRAAGPAQTHPAWDTPEAPTDPGAMPTLFETLPLSPEDVLAEHRRQRAVVAQHPDAGRLATLLAVESAGALAAAEMRHDGLPWSHEIHDRALTATLGPRPLHGGRPPVLATLADDVRAALDAPRLNPDSAVEVLRALRSAGIEARTTRTWELREIDHPAIPPLLEYKKLARLHAANGWAWLDAWVRPGPRGRFHAEYVPGGVVTGRWAARGGGVLQLPKVIRAAVVADPGWRLVVADAAQLEPRVLAAMSRDERMASAGRGADLYQGLVDSGVVDTRAHAKVAMLGALYGATNGQSGELVPRLTRAFPRALAVVEEAARRGEAGGTVRTWLGRTSPTPPERWHEVQRRASEDGATEADRRRAGTAARDWGRFTRNFVVQGSAAEWALCWMADLRARLRLLMAPGTGGADETASAADSGSASDPGGAPHLVLFLHDELVVHTPEHLAEEVATAVREAAASAGRLLFGTFPIDFPLDVAVVESYGDAG